MSARNLEKGIRLDTFLVQKAYFKSRDRANQAVRNGQIMINGKIVKKPAFLLEESDKCEILKGDFNFVGRGALKLAGALNEWDVDVCKKNCLDIGVATGGFSDLLLQNGARKVIGVDVGEGQIAEGIRKNPNFEFRNFTDGSVLRVEDFKENLDLIVVDVSFVSIAKFFEALARISSAETLLLLLVKPQFETGKSHEGVVKDEKLINEILTRLKKTLIGSGFKLINSMPCPVKGKEGNQEYWWMVRKKI